MTTLMAIHTKNTSCKETIGISSGASALSTLPVTIPGIHGSDDGSHFKHNKTPQKMTCGLVFVQGWPLNTSKNNKERQTLDCNRVAA